MGAREADAPGAGGGAGRRRVRTLPFMCRCAGRGGRRRLRAYGRGAYHCGSGGSRQRRFFLAPSSFLWRPRIAIRDPSHVPDLSDGDRYVSPIFVLVHLECEENQRSNVLRVTKQQTDCGKLHHTYLTIF